ncbi:MAG TPA: hypothetical protein VIH45_09030 [Desulfuromonadaceae bacterium]
MITIVNVTPVPQPFGENVYEIRIDRNVMTTFTHTREQGLAECLQKAAEAVERHKWCKVLVSEASPH